jgi:DNA-binding MarR family transcriptional regulator
LPLTDEEAALQASLDKPIPGGEGDENASPWGDVAWSGTNTLSREARLAALVLAARRRREALFGAALFADPAWDMLLELFVREARGSPVHVSNLCTAAAVPTTTALRWIGTLAEAGLVERRPTGSQRRVEIRLTPRAHQLMVEHLRGTAPDILSLSRCGDEAPPEN